MHSTNLPMSLIGSLVLASATALAAEPKAAGELGDVQPVCQTTVLTTNGQAPVILAPADGAARVAAEKLRGALHQRLGVEPRVLSRIAEATPGQATVIALGNMLDNELISRLYWSRYCYEDALFPGPDGYTVHTVYDPHPWGGGRNVIVLGASRPEQLGKAVERFLGLLQGDGQATALPYVLIVEPAMKLSDAARAKMLAKPVDPSFTALPHQRRAISEDRRGHLRPDGHQRAGRDGRDLPPEARPAHAVAGGDDRGARSSRPGMLSRSAR